ncbi:hypothetical protein VC83_04388 [Pseudogymnoascus destructans]|uniref:Uncharacterized protein n=2 Tax=Pseudogymnoascus destructans TaxID=655981 RepID=L8G921_PSED2|nr:uncharacterized protein VC83_07599 [Pseudogymnoascus destructans]XP_024324454.1 uncharacterized protein VC83_04388 [Pseudogymnoascus destructans]ELR09118.1 hypothetical protein GMDG_03698 [Pseudogymnoascus destructans 20631-21]OAF55502.1 hypothetical protein VC83_07599 [Pseudogymnoascus destructans]OAF59170.1 hypothetical protein VC83_04388 [Pseudogymnoascus destructans]
MGSPYPLHSPVGVRNPRLVSWSSVVATRIKHLVTEVPTPSAADQPQNCFTDDPEPIHLNLKVGIASEISAAFTQNTFSHYREDRRCWTVEIKPRFPRSNDSYYYTGNSAFLSPSIKLSHLNYHHVFIIIVASGFALIFPAIFSTTFTERFQFYIKSAA